MNWNVQEYSDDRNNFCEGIVQLLVECFENDDVTRQFFPSRRKYPDQMAMSVQGTLSLSDNVTFISDRFRGDLVVAALISRKISSEMDFGNKSSPIWQHDLFEWREQIVSFSGATRYLEYVCVREHYRSLGLGTTLMQRLLSLAKENDEVIYLETSSAHGAEYFRGFGFRPVSVWRWNAKIINYAMIWDQNTAGDLI